RGGATRRAGRRLHHRSRAEDARRGRAARRAHGGHPADPRRLPRGVRAGRDRGIGAPMAVNVRIPTQLRELSGGAAEVDVDGATVAEVLKRLEAAHRGFAARLYDDQGELRRFVNVFVADEDIRFLQGLDTPVAAGQVVSIVPAVAGGA